MKAEREENLAIILNFLACVGFGQIKLQLLFDALISFLVKCLKNMLPVKAFRVDHCSSLFQLYWRKHLKIYMGRNSDMALGEKKDDLIGLRTNSPNLRDWINIEDNGQRGMEMCYNHNLSCVPLNHGISFSTQIGKWLYKEMCKPFLMRYKSIQKVIQFLVAMNLFIYLFMCISL